MDLDARIRLQLRAWLATWRGRQALACSPRYQATERRALRRAVSSSAIVVAVVLVVGSVVSKVMDPLAGWQLIALTWAAAAISLILGRLVGGRARRQVAGIAYLWGLLLAVDLLATGLTSPLQLRISAMIMPAIPLLYALFMPWTTRAHLIAVGWSTAAALLLMFALHRAGVDPVSPIALTAIVTGAISVVGHAHRRADRIEAYRQVAQIRALHARARDAGRRLRDANRDLASTARLDPVTGTANRRQLDEDLRAIDAADPAAGQDSAFVLVDLDRFKAYNDRHGHLAGDWVLRRVADALGESIRSADRLYRYGGEELCAILAGVDERATEAIVTRMLASIRALEVPHPENRPWQVVSASAGWAIHRPGATSTAAALEAADEALYRAKRLGRNCAAGTRSGEREEQPA